MPKQYGRPLLTTALLFCTLPAWAQSSPEDKGKALVDAQCNSCHPLGARTGSGYDAAGWKTVMRMMINHGVPVAKEDLGPMTDYLAKTYPVKNRPVAVLVAGPH